MNDTFMKEKPVLPLILSMSLPMVLSMLVNSLYNIVDSFFVAQISEEAMTALSLVYPVQNFINAAGIGLGVGINAVIAFYLGAGDHEKTDQAATQGLVLAVIHGVVMTVCCIAIMPVFLRMFTSSEAVIELGVRYSIVAFAFTLIVTVSMAFEKTVPGSRKHEDNHDQPDVRVHHKHRLRPRSDFWLWPIPGNGKLKALRWQPASDRL